MINLHYAHECPESCSIILELFSLKLRPIILKIMPSH